MPTKGSMQRRTAGLAAALAALAIPQAAGADERTGGASASVRPQIASAACDAGAAAAGGCPEGTPLALRGERLADIERVVFLGRPGRTDDLRVRPSARSPHRVLVRVPARARTGPLRAISRTGRASSGGPRLLVASSQPAAPSAPVGDGVFPVRGRYDFGTGTNAFGGGRGHQGQDIFAACDTPVVAARAGRVIKAATAGSEGNYVVLESPDEGQQAYLHMLEPSSVRRGDQVTAGQPIGKVGETGNAVGCHLHFELWTAPGRFTGGRAFDPRPELDRWAVAGEG
jgi:murein DD-endopeptidase MepM/ murein hydrolase activator NlpD